MNEQLVALASVHELLGLNGIEYWLFGGWVCARVIDRDVLARGKARVREDPGDAAKDAADFAALSQP
jgi:hypothetical protein